MSQFDRAREKYERRHGKPEEQTAPEPPKKSNDAILDVSIDLMGDVYQVRITISGVAGNVPPSQLNRQGFSLLIKEALTTKFGKNIYVHDVPGGG